MTITLNLQSFSLIWLGGSVFCQRGIRGVSCRFTRERGLHKSCLVQMHQAAGGVERYGTLDGCNAPGNLCGRRKVLP